MNKKETIVPMHYKGKRCTCKNGNSVATGYNSTDLKDKRIFISCIKAAGNVVGTAGHITFKTEVKPNGDIHTIMALNVDSAFKLLKVLMETLDERKDFIDGYTKTQSNSED